MYTSGTTGQPKGAVITHGMTFWNCVNLGGPAYISPSSVFLGVLPLFHTGGLNCYTNPVLHAGGTVLIMRAFDPAAALELISDPKRAINAFFGVPSIYQFMAQHPGFESSDFSRLIIGGVGGAPMPVPLLKVWEQRGVALQQGYGMTETSPAVLTLDREDAARKAGSSGKPVLHTEVRIVQPDGSDAAIGEIGELWVKGPNITPGYWNRPDANRSSFTDGWLHTGDAARIDEEGFYYIVDRWKDMYISGGENVYPAEVENVLHQIAAVAEAAVIGIPSEQWGEVGMAIVAVKPPRRAMFVPAARTPMNRNRLTVVTAKIPKGTAEANRKKLLTRTAVGLCAKNKRTSSAGAKGVTYGAPCLSVAAATRPPTKTSM